MFNSFLAVPIHFTVEFLGFLVASGGAFLVISRPNLVPGPNSNRVAAAFGLGIIAAAQVAHGGSFFPRDGGDVLIGIYALGLAVLAVAISSAVRPPSSATRTGAILGLPIKQPIALAPAGAAVFLSVVSIIASLRGGPKALRRLAAGALVLAASFVFVSLSPDAEFGTGAQQTAPYVAHALKAAGFLLIGSWLWSGVRSSIRIRFVASFAMLLVLVVLTLATALTGVITSSVQDDELDRVSSQVDSINQRVRLDTQTLANSVHTTADSDELQNAAGQGGGTAVQSAVQGLAQNRTNDLDFVLALDPDGRRIASAGHGPVTNVKGPVPKLTADVLLDIIGSDVVDSVLGPVTKEAASPDRVGSNSVAIIAAAEISNPRREGPAGELIIGRYIDANYIEQAATTLEPARPSLIVNKKVVASELAPGVAAKLRIPRSVQADLGFGGADAQLIDVANRSFFSAFAPLQAGGRPVPGAVLVLSSPAEIVTSTREGVTRTLFLVAMGAGAVVLVLAFLSGRRITRPIQILTQTAANVREGDLTARARVTGEDEVGQLGDTFNEMTAALARTTDDLRDAAQEEQRLRARIETIIQSMADGLVAVDSNKKVLAFNAQAERLTGIKADRVLGNEVENVLDVRDVHGNRVSLGIFDLTQGTVSGVFMNRKGGDQVPITVDTAVLGGGGEDVAGAVAVLRDMTREREIERMKSEFLANISHELRTPLTPIKGYAEILGRKDVAPEKARQFATGILDSTTRLERIVELLVDFSAMEAGRLSPRARPVDLGEVVQALADKLEKRATRHEVVVDVKSRLPKVLGDERLLRRSLEEVLDNAVKFSPDGGVIKLEARGSSTNGTSGRRAVSVTITDEGIGIPEEDLSKIFTDFQQLDGSETRTYGGLGLGLAFVQRIVEAHAGKVEVQSEPDKGTRLTITIPAAQKRKAGSN